MKNVIGVVGIGYVGLPLAISFSKKYKVIAYDNDVEKINKYKKGIDVTKSNYDKEIKQSSIIFTSEYNDLKECNIYIVCVPTPITKKNKPLLSYLITATKTIGKILEKGDIVIYESTVYPGTTEEICIPILEDNSNLKLNKDFGVGFSPERINPGDTNHTFTNINKIVSASNAIYLKYIHNIYQLVMDSNIYDAPNIKTAEMSKIIENCQRDINIAFINEMSNISEKLNIDMSEVLAAAKTKWNFLDFKPGLVGGHCIGVDPYYLIYKAKKLKYNPKLLKISRKTNEDVYKRIVKNIKIILKKNNIKIKNSKILFLGVTFKENVSDVRNSKVIDMINLLKNKGADVIASDYNVCPDEFYEKNGFKLVEEIEKVDVVIIAVKHKKYMNLSSDYLNGLFRSDKKILFDIHSIYDKEEMKKKGFEVWSL